MKKKAVAAMDAALMLSTCMVGSNLAFVNAATTKKATTQKTATSKETANQKAMAAYEKILEKKTFAKGGFVVKDVNKDGIKELFVTKSFRPVKGETKCYMYDPIIYTYESGKVKKVSDFTDEPKEFYYSTKKNTIAADWCSCGGVNVDVYKLQKGKMKRAGYLYSAPIEGTGHCNADSDYAYEYQSFLSNRIIKLNVKSFKHYNDVYKKVKIATVKNNKTNRTKYLK